MGGSLQFGLCRSIIGVTLGLHEVEIELLEMSSPAFPS